MAFAENDAAAVLVRLGTAVELEDDTGKTLYKTVGLHKEIVKTLIEYPLGRAVVALAATDEVMSEELEEVVLVEIEADVDVGFGIVMVLYSVVVEDKVVCLVEAAKLELAS